MALRSPKKCDGNVLVCPLNPLGWDCLSCKRYSGFKPKPMRALPGYERFTAWDNPPPENAQDKRCAYCNRLFFAPANWKYCCRSCAKKAYRRRRAMRGNAKRQYEPRTCEICGKTFIPHTDMQRTCGGACNAEYMRRAYRKGMPKNYPAMLESIQKDLSKMETRANCPAHHLRECVEQIKRHNPNADVTPSSLDALAALLAARLSWWRSISRPRQAVLLDVAVTYGVHGLLSMERLLVALRAGKWEQARQAMLNSRYASLAGKGAVENARQLSTGAWTIIPEYIAEDDEDDENDESGEYRFF